MMHTVMGTGIPNDAPLLFTTGPLIDDYSRQLAMGDAARRSSRSSNVYRPSSSMRVVKPSSASNSPQAMMARRRTLMNDGNLARRRQQALDQALFQQMQGTASPYEAFQEPVKRASRPVSWHPSSHIQQRPQMMMHQQMQQMDFSQFMTPPTLSAEQDFYLGYQNYPPTPAAYSGHTSPLSTFSPLSLPFAASSQQAQALPPYIAADAWCAPTQYTPAPMTADDSPSTTEAFPSYTGQQSFNWESYGAQGFNSCTAPPTPDNFQPMTQQDATVPSEDSIPYRPLEEPEEEGEILIGMGLYDTPDKTETDPGLDNYRTTTSLLLGTTYRKGAGLKLEEAWEPPTKDDDEDDDQEDAEGEDQEEVASPRSSNAQQSWI